MIVFCHLLNDNSGSPRVLQSAIEALRGEDDLGLLYVGSMGRGLLEGAAVKKQRYWYRRSRFRLGTLFALIASQIHLYIKLSRQRAIPHDAVIYVNTLLPFGAALWARRNGRNVICHVHEVSISPAPLRWFLTKVAARTADILIYVSHDHLKRLPIDRKRSIVLANPVSPSLQLQGMTQPYRPRRSGSFEVLMLASPRDFKGVPEFLKVARALYDRTDIVFTLVLNAEAEEIGLYLERYRRPGNVRVYARTDDPSRFYASADLVVNLSRVDQWIETFGLTLVEAMSFGIPVIAPPIGGPAELVSDGGDGLLIDSREEAAVAAAIRRLADSPELCSSMSLAARSKAGTFSQDAFANELRNHVRQLKERGAAA